MSHSATGGTIPARTPEEDARDLAVTRAAIALQKMYPHLQHDLRGQHFSVNDIARTAIEAAHPEWPRRSTSY